jgi:hypothetical protein
VWQDATNGTDIKARRVSDAGVREATRTIRNTTAFENQPSVAITSDGQDYVVAYNREIHSGGLVADHVDVTRVTRSGTTDIVQGHQTLGQGMDVPSISVDGADRFLVGYNDMFDQQVIGRWGQMGTAAPSDKLAHDFEIDVVFGTGLSAAQRNIFLQAADRWEEVILGDLPNVTVDGELIDDVQIDAAAADIDGVNGILGQAGPTTLRNGSQLPSTGVMQFDTADLANMESNGTLFNVILHEMGHVLGIGTLWDNLGLIQGAGSGSPTYTGANGVAGYNAARGFMGIWAPASSVPVEGDGGSGTADSHWDEDILNTELMTGFVESAGVAMPLSRMTVGSLQDMGYSVNYAAADPFSAPFVITRTVRPLTLNSRMSIRAEQPAMMSAEKMDESGSKREIDLALPTRTKSRSSADGLEQFAKGSNTSNAARDAIDAVFALNLDLS